MGETRDIVVIGASAGGLEAVCKLTRLLPARLPAAVLIVLHTSSASPRALAQIIGRCTPLVVFYGNQGDEVRPGCVYIAPPDLHMIVTAPGFIGLNAGPKVRFTRPAADRLFQTAAAIYGRRAIGIVLTGGDHDGTDGLRAIKAAGGIAIIQQPAEAAVPSMPLSALRDDHPDYCVSLDEMGPLLVDLVGAPGAKV